MSAISSRLSRTPREMAYWWYVYNIMCAGGKTREKLKTFWTLLLCTKKKRKLKNNINEELWLLRHEDDCVAFAAPLSLAGARLPRSLISLVVFCNPLQRKYITLGAYIIYIYIQHHPPYKFPLFKRSLRKSNVSGSWRNVFWKIYLYNIMRAHLYIMYICVMIYCTLSCS